MHRSLFTSLAALAIAGTFLVSGPAMAKKSAHASESSDPNDPVIARVNGDVIHRSDVQAVLRQIFPSGKEPPTADLQKLYPRIVDDLISRKLAYQEAEREGVQNDPEVKHAEAIAQQQIVEQAFFHKVGAPAVTDQKLHEAYDEAVKTQGPQEEAHARQIVVKTEDEAKDIVKQLDEGADFQKLAKEKSIDKANAQDGGDLGFFTKGNMDPAVADAAFALQPNTYTKTPVKSSIGWHVIQLVEKRPAKVPSFEEAKGQLSTQLAQRAIQMRLREIAKNAKIEVFNPDGSVLTPPPAGQALAPVQPASPSAAPSSAAPSTGAPALQLPQTQSTP